MFYPSDPATSTVNSFRLSHFRTCFWQLVQAKNKQSIASRLIAVSSDAADFGRLTTTGVVPLESQAQQNLSGGSLFWIIVNRFH